MGKNLNANINLGWGAPGFYAGTTDADGDFDGAIDADSANNKVPGYNGEK